MEQHAEVLHGGTWRTGRLAWGDVLALFLLVAVLLLIGNSAQQMVSPYEVGQTTLISLDPTALPGYALRTTIRMLAALAASLLFTFTYGALAAKSRRLETVLIPVLDVLQSVPILGYLSVTVLFFVSLSPHRILGAELAAIFAIFTSQAWNMAFSFYQSLRTVPLDLDEASHSFRLSSWQRFWRLEVPFAMPGLLWNTMMSMSGGWFFVVASEAIAVGKLHIALPGIGSYLSRAIEARNVPAVLWAIVAMLATILAYDQLLFRPLVAWADKFRLEQTALQVVSHSWLLDVLRRSALVAKLTRPFGAFVRRWVRARMVLPVSLGTLHPFALPMRWLDLIWYMAVAAATAATIAALLSYAQPYLTTDELRLVWGNALLTLTRVTVLVVLTSLVWVPMGVMIGLHPRVADKVQPIVQFLAAFPANLLFPVAVVGILRFHLEPRIWLCPLMILGTQWYILFNVIAGASALPSDFREAAAVFHVRGWRWWRQILLPGIFPYYVTGAITASGGAWNASIVAETVNWGATKLTAGGLGAYIAQATEAGDFQRITLGVAVMSICVVTMNRLVWRPLYAFSERRTRLN